MRKSRQQEALEYMHSKPWLCGPSKVAIARGELFIASLPGDSASKLYERTIRKAAREILEDGREGMLLLSNRRQPEGCYRSAAFGVCGIAEDVHRAIMAHGKTDMDSQTARYMGNYWTAVRENPNQRVSMPIEDISPDGTVTGDALLFTAVSSAYPEGHPRHFPMDALAATRMSTINAIAAKISGQIYRTAGRRAGGEYATGDFFVFPGVPTYAPPETQG